MMRIVSPVITMDVDIEDIHVQGDQLILSGFAGVEEINAKLSGPEALSLLFKLMRFSVFKLILKSLGARKKSAG